MATERWPDEVRDKALRLYREVGPAEASRQTGVPSKTISSWADRAGVQSDAPEKTARAVEQAKLSREARKARLADELLRVAEEEIDRLRRPVTERRVSAKGDLVEWEESEPLATDRRQIITVAAIAIDKSQLLAGDATSRTEQVSTQELERLLNEAIPDAERRRHLALQVLRGGVEGVGEEGAGKAVR